MSNDKIVVERPGKKFLKRATNSSNFSIRAIPRQISSTKRSTRRVLKRPTSTYPKFRPYPWLKAAGR